METDRKKGTAKRFLSTISAGVVGSMLTLGVVANTDLLSPAPQEKAITTTHETPYNIEQTSAKTDLTLSDMVADASSGIVGIVNYQNKGNRFAQDVQSIESGSGSGVIYKVEGDKAYIVTNNHVIEGSEKIEISLESGEDDNRRTRRERCTY